MEQSGRVKRGVVGRTISVTRLVRAGVILVMTFYFLFIPAFAIMGYLCDPGAANGGMCAFLYRWHQDLSGRYESWAQERVRSARAAELDIENISGTEWPLISAACYLWATEALQEAWEKDPGLCATAPADSAKGAIEAAAALLVDPVHASWVKQHWGESYLEKENLFYRMLLIQGMTSYQKLTGDRRYEALLRQQVDSLSQELDASPFGLLDDYPGQCYPVDIMPAYAGIQRADRLLGMDHSAVVQRGIRAFQENRLDSNTGLPAYAVDSETGYRQGPARGIGMSFMLIWAPELWPEAAAEWYGRYAEQFWQSDRLVAGFREFSHASIGISRWFIEVDAGPVMAGYGAGASAMGIGAARANGRMDHAYPLTALAVMGAWRLPDGTLAGPRLLSDAVDAPYLGEAALLFSLSRMPVAAVEDAPAGGIPLMVYLVLGAALVLGVLLVYSSVLEIRRTVSGESPYVMPWKGVQLVLRGVLLAGAGAAFFAYGNTVGILVLIAAVIFPYIAKKKVAGRPVQRGRD